MSKKNNVLSLDSDEFLVRIAWCYYKADMTQSKIAKKFNTNRVKVKQLLEEAFKKGIVEINIKNPYVNLLNIEKKLIEQYSLLDCIVIPSDDNLKPNELNIQLGLAASQYISSIFNNDDILTIGWGDSVSKTIKNLSLDKFDNFYLVGLSGGVLPLISEANFFGKYSDHLKVMPAPLLVSNKTTAKAIYQEPEVKNIIKLWDIANYALIGIGALNKNATIVKKGYISEVELASLKKKNVVGDILGQFIDQDGKIIPHDTDDRLIAQDIKKIKDMPNVIAVAGGKYKTKAIKAALKEKYINTLITDEGVAKELLNID